MLGVSLAKVELNETNLSEVLRLFILSRNAGDPHPVCTVVEHFFYSFVQISPKQMPPFAVIK